LTSGEKLQQIEPKKIFVVKKIGSKNFGKKNLCKKFWGRKIGGNFSGKKIWTFG
jgi:hypothetical protein